MKKWMLFGFLFLALLLSGCAPSTPQAVPAEPAAPQPTSPPVPTGAEPTAAAPTDATAPTFAPTTSVALDGKTLLEKRCASCHILDAVYTAGYTKPGQWTGTVIDMVGRGAILSDEEIVVLTQYLMENYVNSPSGTSPQSSQPSDQPAQASFSNFSTADFSGPSSCVSCHTGLKDQAGNDVSMPIAWHSTMMANSARDPVWQAKVSSEVARLPELQAVIEQKCTTCHMPMAETQALTDGQPIAMLDEGFINPSHPLHAAAMDGTSCTLCHQIGEQKLGEMKSFSGGYIIDTSTNPPDRLIFGPYEQPVAQDMKTQSGFTPSFGAHLSLSAECATCHNLYTPYVDAQGQILGEFPEQTPFTEWEYSQFNLEGKSCQSCHMPTAEGSVVISQVPANLEARSPFFQHYFVGGNHFILQMLSAHSEELEVIADQSSLSTTMERVEDQIGSRTAKLTLADLVLEGSQLTASLQVDNLTGHKFPTSFPSRRAWLFLTVTGADGQVIFQSGKPNPDGTINGNAGDLDPTAYEPHYDLISLPDQVQIYEPIMGNSDGQVTYTLLRAGQFLKDNRLLPAGADKANLIPDIAVYGEAAEDANFVGGSDLVTYQVNLGEAVGPFAVTAELFYEPLAYQFIQDMLLDGTPLTERFAGYYQTTDRKPLLVAVIEPTSIAP